MNKKKLDNFLILMSFTCLKYFNDNNVGFKFSLIM